jgi:hypothetical protein
VPAGMMGMHGGTHRAVIPAEMPGFRPGMATVRPSPT